MRGRGGLTSTGMKPLERKKRETGIVKMMGKGMEKEGRSDIPM
jgi:hypothetical protein